VFAINDQIDERCPKCINDTVYVEKLISLPIEEGEFYLCRCGKCGWRFRCSREVRRSTKSGLAIAQTGA
jgi:DNA-directed RNA polymerase subunit M/transcription elongation factor TFIIS